MSRKPKIRPAVKPAKPKPRAIDGMPAPNHLCPRLVDLKVSAQDGKTVSAFVRRHEKFAGAKKYYPDNPDGAMFACTWVNPFQLEKLLQAQPALRTEAAKAVEFGRRTHLNEASTKAVNEAIEALVADIRDKLLKLTPLLRDYAVTSIVRTLSEPSPRVSKSQE